MATVGVRELKNRLSAYLGRVKQGETVTVTERGHPVAELIPAHASALRQKLEPLIRAGLLTWKGGKPHGLPRPVRARGGNSASRIVVEDRR